MERLRRVVLDRLIRYYRYLVDVVSKQDRRTITSAQLGAALDVDASQVRKDFAAVGLVGLSRIGYDVCEVCRAIRRVVGFDHEFKSVLIGAGKLGSAILAYSDFERYGLRVIGVFDGDPFKVGRRMRGHTIQPIHELTSFIGEREVPLAILTVPGEAAQDLSDLLVASGVEAIWNFTPIRLAVPQGVLARNARFSAGLAEIAYHLNRPEPAGRVPSGV